MGPKGTLSAMWRGKIVFAREYRSRRRSNCMSETWITEIWLKQDAVNSFFPDRALKHFDVLEFVQRQGECSKEHDTVEAAPC